MAAFSDRWSHLSFDAAPAATIREWRRLLGFSAAHRYKAGTRLLDQADTAGSVYLIESGLVKLSRVGLDGRSVTLLLRFPGDLVGIYGTLLGMPHFISATTVTDSQVLEISGDHAMHVFHANTEAAAAAASGSLSAIWPLQSTKPKTTFASFWRSSFTPASATAVQPI